MTTRYEIRDNNSNGSYTTYGWLLESRECPVPELKRITVELPQLDGALDFTYAFGTPRYNPRTCTYVFTRVCESAEDMREREEEFGTWLMSFVNATLRDMARDAWLYEVTCTGCEFDEGAGGHMLTCTAQFEALDPWWHVYYRKAIA